MKLGKFRFNDSLNVMQILVYISCIILFLVNGINTENFDTLTSSNGLITTQTLTLLRQYADTLFLQCHETSFFQTDYLTTDRIMWLNEKDTFNIRDQNIIINLDNVISSASQLNFQLDTRLSQVSCGYLNHGRYYRIKKWQMRYIEHPVINLRVRTRPESIYFRRLNESFAHVSVPSLSSVYYSNKPLDIIKLSCESNFDYPIDRKYIRMYLRNPLSSGIETWYLDESIDNSFQFFTKLNDESQQLPLSDFLRLILNDNTDTITFQCTSKYEIGNGEPFLLTSSRNLSIAKGDFYILDQSSSANQIIYYSNKFFLLSHLITIYSIWLI